MASELLAFVPLRLEQAALGRHRGWKVLHTGMGPERARIAAARGLAVDAPAVAVIGVCGAVSPDLRAGDVVCATELRRVDAASVSTPDSALLADALSRRGLRVHVGSILCVDRILPPGELRALRGEGVLGVDTESAWLAAAADDRPFAVIRVVLDTGERGLLDPRTLPAAVRASRGVRLAGDALAEWAGEVAARSGARRAKSRVHTPPEVPA
jgi:4-hydroxy-3-methylbut-2-enyl diphosphate reductase